ncbi:hypothetical protein BB412_02910 [Helicobacter pylori]|nr:hypothetical protein BB412_02910 [Helicobacter pylori]
MKPFFWRGLIFLKPLFLNFLFFKGISFFKLSFLNFFLEGFNFFEAFVLNSLFLNSLFFGGF